MEGIDDVGGGARELISDLDGSLGSRYFVGNVNKRTSFASCADTVVNVVTVEFRFGAVYSPNNKINVLLVCAKELKLNLLKN